MATEPAVIVASEVSITPAPGARLAVTAPGSFAVALRLPPMFTPSLSTTLRPACRVKFPLPVAVMPAPACCVMSLLACNTTLVPPFKVAAILPAPIVASTPGLSANKAPVTACAEPSIRYTPPEPPLAAPLPIKTLPVRPSSATPLVWTNRLLRAETTPTVPLAPSAHVTAPVRAFHSGLFKT